MNTKIKIINSNPMIHKKWPIKFYFINFAWYLPYKKCKMVFLDENEFIEYSGKQNNQVFYSAHSDTLTLEVLKNAHIQTFDVWRQIFFKNSENCFEFHITSHKNLNVHNLITFINQIPSLKYICLLHCFPIGKTNIEMVNAFLASVNRKVTVKICGSCKFNDHNY
jgi:hypothetical protein